jgi:hypothetical protein
MKYEIPREAFKQRLEDRLNFVFVDLQPTSSSTMKFENIEQLSYGPQFKTEFSAKYPSKTQNVVLYSMKKGDEAPAHAADELAAMGYQFVYFYTGSADDLVLDKGMN